MVGFLLHPAQGLARPQVCRAGSAAGQLLRHLIQVTHALAPFWCRTAGQQYQSMVQQLMGQLSGPLFSSLLANATTLASTTAGPQGRLLLEQVAAAPAPAAEGQRRSVPARRRASLAGRFAELRGTRVALRARLRHERAQRRAAAGATAATTQRRLQQAEEDAAAAQALAPLLAALQSAVDAGTFQLGSEQASAAAAAPARAAAAAADKAAAAADTDAKPELADGGRAYLPAWLLEEDVEEDAPLWSVDDWGEDSYDAEGGSGPYFVVVQVRHVVPMVVGGCCGRAGAPWPTAGAAEAGRCIRPAG